MTVGESAYYVNDMQKTKHQANIQECPKPIQKISIVQAFSNESLCIF